MRYREIAVEIGAPVSTVAEWIHQGLASLREGHNGHSR